MPTLFGDDYDTLSFAIADAPTVAAVDALIPRINERPEPELLSLSEQLMLRRAELLRQARK